MFLKTYKLENFDLNSKRLYIFTDGYSESLDDNQKEIGIEGVKKLITKHKNSSLNKELQNMTEEIKVRSLKKDYLEQGIEEKSNILEDDLTIIGIGK